MSFLSVRVALDVLLLPNFVEGIEYIRSPRPRKGFGKFHPVWEKIK